MSKSLLQQLALAASGLNPAFAEAGGWMESVWKADRAGYERLILERLNKLAADFSATGLRQLPGSDVFPAKSFADVEQWQIFEREQLQAMWGTLQERYRNDSRYIHYQSGGSTGEPTQLYRLKTTNPLERLTGLNMLKVVGWTPGTVRLALWGSDRDLGLKLEQKRGLKQWLSQQLLNVIAIGGYAPDDSLYREFADCVMRHPGCAVYGYAGLLDECAKVLIRENLTIPPGHISAFWSTAEMLSQEQRQLFHEAFGAEVRDFYGSRECPYMAAECVHGTRHISPRYYMEVVDASRNKLPAGVEGELCVTDLFNSATPLIRYMIGDMGSVEWQSCPCGRNSLVMTRLTGRVNDVIRLKSGRYLSSVFFPQVVKQFPALKKAQLVRLGEEHFEMRYTGVLTADEVGEIKRIIRDICEGATADVTLVDEVPLTPQGKLMYYVDEWQR